jgi:hypothetical protein
LEGRPKRIFAAIALISSLAGAIEAGAPPSAEAVLAASKQATGGAAWDRAQGCYEEGTHGDGAIRYTTRFSLERYGMRVDSESGGKTRSMGFDGTAGWRSDGEGRTMVAGDPSQLPEAVLTAYISVNGFYFPDRFPAVFRYLREASEAGQLYDVLEISPSGGRSFEIWFDRSSHLIRRVVDGHGNPPTKVEADEYRRIGGYLIASSLTIFGPNGAVADHGAVSSFRCGPIDTTIFNPPKPR